MKFFLILPALILCGCASAKPKDCPSRDLQQAYISCAKQVEELEMRVSALQTANDFLRGNYKPEQPRDHQGRFIKGVDTAK